MIAGRDRVQFDDVQELNGASGSGSWVVDMWHGRKVAVSAWGPDDVESRKLADRIAELES